MKRKLVLLISSGLGLGYAPLAPGTFGTLLGVAIFYFMGRLPWYGYVAAFIPILLIGVYTSHEAEKILFTRDPQMVTIDEVVGYLVAMFLMPVTWKWMLAGFILFRLFDTTKPWPASHFDKHSKLPGAVVYDDVMAGIYANLCLQIFRLIYFNL